MTEPGIPALATTTSGSLPALVLSLDGRNGRSRAIAQPDDASLARRLTTADAVVVGLGAMIGAGVFSALGPAADAAGAGLLFGLAIAALVAYGNATSSAQLAAVYPESGGTYVYGREQLGPFWGYLAGWAFVVGKVASCAVMALTFGVYAHPDLAQPLALGAIVAITAVNASGIRKTVDATKVLLVVVLASLATVVLAGLLGGQADPGRLRGVAVGGPFGILQAAGLLFFAFAGYARIATLGEEVRDPERSIPRAIPLALGITLLVYASVAAAALLAAGPERLAASAAPLAEVFTGGPLEGLGFVVGVGATVASLGALLSLSVGVSRTAFAMARNVELPRYLSRVGGRSRVPYLADLTVAVVVGALVLAFDLAGAIGFSSFTVLVYYTITNVSAWRLPPARRRWPRGLAVMGALGCLLLAFSLPLTSVLGGTGVLAAGAAVWGARHLYR